jgi:hypothetical protein
VLGVGVGVLGLMEGMSDVVVWADFWICKRLVEVFES